MNGLEFFLLAVVGLVCVAGFLATIMLSLWIIKMCVREIAAIGRDIKRLFVN